MKLNHGSNWIKVDLHLHTPSSFDYKNKSITNEEIIQGLKQKGIELVAITDHHFIDIDRVKELQTLGNKEGITVLPGIELRSELGGSESIHFIGIFPEHSNIQDIWIDIQSKCSIKKTDIEAKGDDKVYCDFEDTAQLFHELGGLVTIHAGNKTNTVENITNALSYKMAIKIDLLNNIDFYEVGSKKDQMDYYEKVYPHIDKKPPIILCSDNHNIREYELKDNCWLKANPCFEGLKQAIFEPYDRVAIQEAHPDCKDDFKLIKAVRFIDSRASREFGDQWIGLNNNLNSIIGGKSAGKSLLLYYIASTIDKERIEQINKDVKGRKLEYPQESEEGFDFEIMWRDGVTYRMKDSDKPNRPITYIPQLYLNTLAEDQKEELNNLVEKC